MKTTNWQKNRTTRTAERKDSHFSFAVSVSYAGGKVDAAVVSFVIYRAGEDSFMRVEMTEAEAADHAAHLSAALAGIAKRRAGEGGDHG